MSTPELSFTAAAQREAEANRDFIARARKTELDFFDAEKRLNELREQYEAAGDDEPGPIWAAAGKAMSDQFALIHFVPPRSIADCVVKQRTALLSIEMSWCKGGGVLQTGSGISGTAVAT
jgi:hypothetical protein